MRMTWKADYYLYVWLRVFFLYKVHIGLRNVPVHDLDWDISSRVQLV